MDDKNNIAVFSAIANLLDKWQLTGDQKISVLGFASKVELYQLH
jgi:hypothetical protein